MMRASLWRIVLRVEACDQKLWGIVRDADQYTRMHGFLFERNMAGRNRKKGKQKYQKGRGAHARNQQYTGRRKTTKK